MTRRSSGERMARAGLWGIFAFAAAAWVYLRFVNAHETLVSTLIVVLLFIAIPLGIFVARRPREIPRTGDRTFDEEIDRVLKRHSAKEEGRPDRDDS